MEGITMRRSKFRKLCFIFLFSLAIAGAYYLYETKLKILYDKYSRLLAQQEEYDRQQRLHKFLDKHGRSRGRGHGRVHHNPSVKGKHEIVDGVDFFIDEQHVNRDLGDTKDKNILHEVNKEEQHNFVKDSQNRVEDNSRNDDKQNDQPSRNEEAKNPNDVIPDDSVDPFKKDHRHEHKEIHERIYNEVDEVSEDGDKRMEKENVGGFEVLVEHNGEDINKKKSKVESHDSDGHSDTHIVKNSLETAKIPTDGPEVGNLNEPEISGVKKIHQMMDSYRKQLQNVAKSNGEENRMAGGGDQGLQVKLQENQVIPEQRAGNLPEGIQLNEEMLKNLDDTKIMSLVLSGKLKREVALELLKHHSRNRPNPPPILPPHIKHQPTVQQAVLGVNGVGANGMDGNLLGGNVARGNPSGGIQTGGLGGNMIDHDHAGDGMVGNGNGRIGFVGNVQGGNGLAPNVQVDNAAGGNSINKNAIGGNIMAGNALGNNANVNDPVSIGGKAEVVQDYGGIPFDVFNVHDVSDESIACVKLNLNTNTTTVCVNNPLLDKPISASLAKNGIWEAQNLKEFQKAMEVCPKCGVIDLGANLGVYSLTAAAYHRPVLAVEPLLENIGPFHRAIQVNKLMDNITILRNAISDEHGYVEMKYPKPMGNLGAAYAVPIDYNHAMRRKTNINVQIVHTITLNDLVKILKFKSAILKVDIQGSEHQMFRAAGEFLNEIDVPFIFMHWSHDENKKESQETADFLVRQGYKPKITIEGTLIELEALTRDQALIIWTKQYT